ncbi:MAG: T9SS type A sorting domain-containing protein [Saprospiraceae bacterium]|nr:T9SS type A sorting domain-containing protein [Candidatus Brachybacter algidus]
MNSVGVIDFTGRPLSNYQLHNNVLNRITIPSRGVYFMVMRTNAGETISRKIIIE